MHVAGFATSAIAAIALSTTVCLAGDDVEPKVAPDRIDDVADDPGIPPPRFDKFDNFSWRAFIALNWPALTDAAHRGEPDRTKMFADPGPRVWETYKARYEVFAPGAPKPAAWGSFDGNNPCGGAVGNQQKALSAFSHYADYNQASFKLGELANPLIAQNRTYTRYEVRFNRDEFNSIVDNEWYIRSKLPTEKNPGTFNDGSIEVKAAWKILTDADVNRDRYYVSKAFVFDAEATMKSGGVVCTEHEVALVGFHIVIKTKLRPQWIWSSFEHIDNVPPNGDEPDAADVPVPYSYNSGKPPADLFPPKAQDTPTITEANPPKADPNPMQVVRKQGIRKETMDRNFAYWSLPEIKGTVWANYMLVMTQWPTTASPPSPTNAGGPFPIGTASTLANTTMETYGQTPGRSCMQCHQEISNKLGMDFVAFMEFDASDPTQEAVARAAAPGMATLTAGHQPKKTALDDSPAVEALIDFLRRE